MRFVHDQIRAHLLRSCGFIDEPIRHLQLDALRRSEWSPTFERLMRNRLIMGAFRYGRLHEPHAPHDNVHSAIARLRRYLKDGNQEHLVDAANLCLVEYVRGECHSHPTFQTVDDGQHTEQLK